jgi:hypothetical protein
VAAAIRLAGDAATAPERAVAEAHAVDAYYLCVSAPHEHTECSVPLEDGGTPPYDSGTACDPDSGLNTSESVTFSPPDALTVAGGFAMIRGGMASVLACALGLAA